MSFLSITVAPPIFQQKKQSQRRAVNCLSHPESHRRPRRKRRERSLQVWEWGSVPGKAGEALTTGLWQLPILVEVGEKQAVDEGGFPQA